MILKTNNQRSHLLELGPPHKPTEDEEIEFAAAIFIFIILCTIATAIGLTVLGVVGWIGYSVFNLIF
jgi:hypothetical protein